MNEKQLVVTEKFSEVRSGLFSPIIPTNFTRWRERSCEVASGRDRRFHLAVQEVLVSCYD